MEEENRETVPQSKLKKHEIFGDMLEDISTLTSEYMMDKLPSLLPFIEDKDRDMALHRVLEELNTPSDGKKYIVACSSSSFLFKRRGEIIKFKNAYPFILPLSQRFPQCIVEHANKILHESPDNDYKYAHYKYTLKYLSNPTSRVYSLFKAKLIS